MFPQGIEKAEGVKSLNVCHATDDIVSMLKNTGNRYKNPTGATNLTGTYSVVVVDDFLVR